MAEITFTDKIKEALKKGKRIDFDPGFALKPFEGLPSQREAEAKSRIDIIRIINSVLSRYNTEIRTTKNIEINGAGRLKIPVFASDPAKCKIGEIALIGGVMKVCDATDTWTAI